MNAVQPVFQAKWNPTNIHLKPVDQTLLRKVAKVVWNILSVLIPIIGLVRLAGYVAGRIANRAILPSAQYGEFEKKQARTDHLSIWHNPLPPLNFLMRNYTTEEYTVKTPDGVDLQATFYRCRNANPATRTVICFQPNGTLAYQNVFTPLIHEAALMGQPLNMVTFDYRGVGESGGKFTREQDLVVDGSSIAQFVHEHLGVQKNLIDFYGYSLGGVQAVKTQALDPELVGNRNVNDRSLASVKAMVYAHSRNMNRFKWAAPFVALAAKSQNYEMNMLADYKKLNGRKLVIYHPEDPVILMDASTKKHIGSIPHESLELETLPEHVGGNAHCILLAHAVKAGTNQSALRVATEFFVH